MFTSEGVAYIFELVPWNPDTERVSIWHGDRELAVRDVSPHPPTVRVLSPNGGEIVAGGSFTVTWSAADADGDPLTFTLLYSSDRGKSWRTLTTGIEETSYKVDASLLIGSKTALVRVMASDGVNTTTDDSDAPFTLTNREPQTSIVWPTDGALFGPDDVVPLAGDAYDPEDGPLADDTLVWESDRDGPLGNGKSLVLAARNLTPGLHHITLTATDSGGTEASASVGIFMGHRFYVPLLLKQ